MSNKLSLIQPKKTPEGLPQTFDEIYQSVVNILIHGDKKVVKKMWKIINSKEECWLWIKMKIITDTYSTADAKGKEQFCLINIKERIKSGDAVELKKHFVDIETKIEYRVFEFKNGRPPYKIPIATEGMDKFAYDKALNKKFVGDFIETHNLGDNTITLTPLDTPEKVQAYNDGVYYDKYVYNRKLKRA